MEQGMKSILLFGFLSFSFIVLAIFSFMIGEIISPILSIIISIVFSMMVSTEYIEYRYYQNIKNNDHNYKH